MSINVNNAALNEILEAINDLPISKEEQTKAIDITENGTTVVTPDEGMTLGEVTVNVEVESGGGGTEEIETLIDQSGVLESTDGTATEKVEQLIDKAEDENLWYEMSGNWTALPSEFSKAQVETLPKMNLSSMTNLNYGFSRIPLRRIDYYLNTDNCSTFNSCFSNCKSLEYMKGINTSKATNFSAVFNGCDILKKIEEPFNFLSMTNQIRGFTWLYALEYIRFESESIPCSIGFEQSKYLTAESIQSIIDGLATVETAQTLTLNATVKAKLTEEQLATITNKNWNLA